MKKEVPKIEEKKESLSDVMKRYDAFLSVELSDGFAHVRYEDDNMVVRFLNDEGYYVEGCEGSPINFKDIERVSNFMRDMAALRLDEFSKRI